MRLFPLAAMLGVLSAAALPAFAGGPVAVTPEPAPMPAPAAMPVGGDWTGLSAGLSLGYGSVDNAGASGQGALYGLRGAYDHDFGAFVLGGTASFDWSRIDAGAGRLNGLGRLGLRGGYDLGDTLVYATGGAAWADLATGGTSAQDTGWFAGIGAEHKLGENWSVDGEVLTNQFGNFNATGTALKATTVSLGVNYRF